MKKLITSIILLLIVYYPYSQTIYPQRVKIDSDTVNIFSDKQVSDILKTFVNEEYLEKEIYEYKKVVLYFDSLVENNNLIIEDYKGIVKTKDNIITLKDKVIESKDNDIKVEKRKKIRSTVIGILSGFTLGLITMLLL